MSMSPADGANREPTATNAGPPAERAHRGEDAAPRGSVTRRRTARRKGKIGRLPRAVREELNRRLLDGEAGGSLLAWLNGGLGARECRPITKQNLSEWRKGGFEDWVERQEPRDWPSRLTEEAQAMEAVAEGRRFSDLSANLAGLELGLLLQTARRMEHGADKVRVVLQIVRELVRLRTSDRASERAQREAGAWDGMAHDMARDHAEDGVQGSPGKLSQIAVRKVSDEGGVNAREVAHGEIRGVGAAPRPQRTDAGAPGGAERVELRGVQGSPRKLSQIAVRAASEEGGGAVRGVGAPRLQEASRQKPDEAVACGHGENSGAVAQGRTGGGMAERPEEISARGDSFSFCPGPGRELTIGT